jgi:hypothetical protein
MGARRSLWWLPPMEEHDSLMRHTRMLRRAINQPETTYWLREAFQSNLRNIRDDIPASVAAIVTR